MHSIAHHYSQEYFSAVKFTGLSKIEYGNIIRMVLDLQLYKSRTVLFIWIYIVNDLN